MFVYMFRNELNGKAYVGQTVQAVEERAKQHFRCAFGRGGRKTPFHAAMKGFGREAFTLTTLQTCETLEELNEAEMAWIERLNCVWPNGYNMTEGGGNERKSDATRAKMSDTHCKRFQAMADSEKIDYVRRRGFSATGSKLSIEARAKISASKTGKCLGVRPSTAKFTSDQIRSIRDRLSRGEATQTELAREFGVSRRYEWNCLEQDVQG